MSTEQVRDALRMPLEGVHLIEASAGTGKTYTLKHLVLRLLVEKGIPIGRILMVTFTNDATAELVERIRGAVESTLEGVRRLDREPGEPIGSVFPDPTLSAQVVAWRQAGHGTEAALAQALSDIDRSRIYTIHGFCQRALTEHVLTRHGDFEPDTEADTDAMAREVVEVFLRRYAARYAQAHRDEPGFRERLGGLLAMQGFLVGFLTGQSGSVPDATYIHPVVMLPRSEGKGVDAQEQATLFAAFLEEGLPEFREAKAKAGALTFDDMLSGMREAVMNPGFRDAVASEYDAVLIDEFQDTDPQQYEIFRRLFIDRRQDGQAPIVVFVGDPKQSIYRFRNAQIETYDAARAAVPKEHIWTLSENHRSAGALVTAVNRLFSRVGTTTVAGVPHAILPFAPTSGVAYDPRIGPLRYQPDASTDVVVPEFEVWADFDLDGRMAQTLPKADARRAGLYRAVASDIANLLAHPVYKDDGKRLRACDIAVLVRRNAIGEAFRDVLSREFGIDARTASDKDVFQTEEAEETVAVLRALSTPDTPGVFDGLLTTRWIGTTYADIVSGHPDALLEVRGQLREAAELFSRSGPLAAFGFLMTRRDTVKRLLLTDDGERRIANYRHVFELLHAKWLELKTAGALLRWFEKERGPGGRTTDARKLRPAADDPDRVSVVTIHGSKGLEYEVVYCLDLAFDAANKADKDAMPILRIPDSRDGYSTTDLVPVFGCRTKDALEEPENFGDAARNRAFGSLVLDTGTEVPAGDLVREAKLREACENVRLAYVATTRAKRRLVIPVSVRAAKNGIYATSAKNTFFRTLVDLTGEGGEHRARNDVLSAEDPTSAETTYGEAACARFPVVLKRIASLLDPPQAGEEDFVRDAGAASHQALLRFRTVDFGGASEDWTLLSPLFFDGRRVPKQGMRSAATPLVVPDYTMARHPYWEQTSFTALIRPVAHHAVVRVAADDMDWLDDEPEEVGSAAVGSDLDLLPYGNQTGTCLHGIVERFPDWEAGARALAEVSDPAGFRAWRQASHPNHALYRFVARALESSGLSGNEEEGAAGRTCAVLRMLRDVLNKRICAACDPTFGTLEGMTLAEAGNVRMAEALFFIDMGFGATDVPDAEALGRALEPLGYGIEGLGSKPLRGFVKGEIDMVFHWKGRFWILDWKTNRIGAEPDPTKRFARASMAEEVRRHGYQLQYLLYATALRRMLRAKFPGADANRMIGGALYVFLRGVNGVPGDMAGFYCDPADARFIQALDTVESFLGNPEGGVR